VADGSDGGPSTGVPASSGAQGCKCDTSTAPSAGWLSMLALLGWRRRR
jgi:MYXO-CTERM domain-containing protein